MMRPIVVSAFIICNKKIFLIYHKKHAMWLPPGGHLEKGESLMEALRRELFEELKLEEFYVLSPNKNKPYYFISSVEYDKYFHEYVILLSDKPKFKFDASEIGKHKWFSLQEVRKSKLLVANLKMKIEKVFSFLNS
jgi:8-oxo-dGTP pyrophosphatase MutT (NUDIX family)